MAVETVAGIADLVSTDPTGSEDVSEGDDHLRVIKEAIQDSFPDFTNADQVVNGLASQIATIHEAKTWTATQTFTPAQVFSAAVSIAGILTTTAQLIVKDGTAASPSISFSSETGTNTGFYWISEGVIGISVDGVSVGRIDSTKLRIVGDIEATGDITAFAP